MPLSIIAAVGLFAGAALCALVQLASVCWFVINDLPHHRPLAGYLFAVPITCFDLGVGLAAVVAGLTLLLGRFARLTVIASGLASLIFPVGTLAMVVTLAVARRHFGWWYRRHPGLKRGA